tara:strand:+ start:800 stop:1204 length:405 start_codon:yes stop_codon:yes gene_type:complete
MVDLIHVDEIVESFDFLPDWEERYTYLIDLGKKLPPMADELKIEANRVQGCVSKVWLVAEDKDGHMHFTADSDAHIVKGLVYILLSAFSGKSKTDIQNVDIDALFAQMGLDKQLSPSRRNGFVAMVERIKSYAA